MEYIHSKFCMCNSCTELEGEYTKELKSYVNKELKRSNEEKRKRYFDKKRFKDLISNIDSFSRSMSDDYNYVGSVNK